MDLIYADVVDNLIIDRGVLNNFSFDLSYGEDENDFQLVIPMSGIRLYEDQVVYIPGTEYGGVIDAIKVDTAAQMITYSGRTWHGILESKVLYPSKGKDYMFVSGEANEVLGILLERMNLIPGDLNELYVRPTNSIITASTEDSGIYIDGKVTSESGNYAHGYSFIRDLLYQNDAKPVIIDGVISAKTLIDYSNSDDFLEGTDQFTAEHKYNSINRLHCLGSGDLRNRYTIDLYLSEGGTLLPYSRENPVKDSDYYIDIAALSQSTVPEDVTNFAKITANMVTGIKEIADIYDYPNAQLTYHYVVQTVRPSDWSTDLTPNIADVTSKDKYYGFQKYFYQNNADGNFRNVEKPSLQKRYDLQLSMPSDWMSNFSNYYMDGAGGYVKVSSVTTYNVVGTMPAGWYEGAYSNYYKLNNGSYTKVSMVPGLVPLTEPPGDWITNWSAYCTADGSNVEGVQDPAVYTQLTSATAPADWKTNYGNYYYWDGLQYQKVRGVSKTVYKKLESKPSNWASTYKNYYIKEKGKWVNCTKASQWNIDKVRMKTSKTVAPSYKANWYYSYYLPPIKAPTFAVGVYFSSGKVVPTWGTFTVYSKSTVPTWLTNKYYTEVQYQPIPSWGSNSYYTQYEDHYQSLIEGALKKIEDSMIKDELEIKLGETTVYDINDRVGASDEVTGIGAVERIIQKVVKIERGVVSYKYNTGK